VLSIRRLLIPITVTAALVLPAPALAACEGDVAPTSPQATAATLCLINAQRSAHGLGALTEAPALRVAAQDFAEDMVARGFFDHVAPGGATLVDRLKAAGWVPSGTWSAGENIAWGSGALGTPERIVDGWMHSSGHRANILNGAFTQIGLGIAGGAPRAGVSGPAGTYVTDFATAATTGALKPKRCIRPSAGASKAAREAAARRCAAAARR
jgi:uncharacterized protein YkwD